MSDNQFASDKKPAIIKQSSLTALVLAKHHLYATDLAGVPFKHNWIFYEADHQKVRLIHIVPSRRNKTSIRF